MERKRADAGKLPFIHATDFVCYSTLSSNSPAHAMSLGEAAEACLGAAMAWGLAASTTLRAARLCTSAALGLALQLPGASWGYRLAQARRVGQECGWRCSAHSLLGALCTALDCPKAAVGVAGSVPEPAGHRRRRRHHVQRLGPSWIPVGGMTLLSGPASTAGIAAAAGAADAAAHSVQASAEQPALPKRQSNAPGAAPEGASAPPLGGGGWQQAADAGEEAEEEGWGPASPTEAGYTRLGSVPVPSAAPSGEVKGCRLPFWSHGVHGVERFGGSAGPCAVGCGACTCAKEPL